MVPDHVIPRAVLDRLVRDDDHVAIRPRDPSWKRDESGTMKESHMDEFLRFCVMLFERARRARFED